ncbi:hypothetical protein Tco_0573334 [Tanacetum coccineum]
MTKSKSFDRNPKHRALYHSLMESIIEDEDAMDKGVADKLKKRKPDDAERDEDTLARPDQGLKRRKTSKDTEQSKKVKSTDTSKGTTKSQPKCTDKSTQLEETVFKSIDTQLPQNLGDDMGKTVDDGPTQNWLSDLVKSEKPSKTFNELMSTPINFTAFAMNRLQISHLIKTDLVGPVNNLLKGTCKSYVELKYNMEEYMVPKLWSPIKVAYDKHAALGTSHWRPKRQRFYRYATNMVSKHDVYSTKRIIAVTNFKVNKWYGYGYLEEIEVQRSDQKLYKFMEGNFPRLHLNDIEDMLLLVESYQKKLNISKPLIHKAGISNLEPYTTYSDPQGFIYLDKLERNRLMYSHELYKFSNGTLISVWDKLKDMDNNLKMGYNSVMPRKRWSNLDKKRSRIMVKDVDRQLLERRLLRSLEKFVGGKEYREDLRLLQRTI